MEKMYAKFVKRLWEKLVQKKHRWLPLFNGQGTNWSTGWQLWDIPNTNRHTAPFHIKRNKGSMWNSNIGLIVTKKNSGGATFPSLSLNEGIQWGIKNLGRAWGSTGIKC